MKQYLTKIKNQFEYYKLLGENTFSQLTDRDLLYQINKESNSISIIVNHLNGNMLSRWTDFLNTDGEKEWRKRDEEFCNKINTREELQKKWNDGWNCLFNTIDSLFHQDLDKIITIRNVEHTVSEALNRQLAHYSYHIGQIVFLGKVIKGKNWKSLSIPKGKSIAYNKEKFSIPKKKIISQEKQNNNLLL